MLKDLKNGEKAMLLEDIKTINDLPIPKDSIFEVVNMLHGTVLIKLDKVHCEHTEFPLQQFVVIKSENMFANVDKV